MQYGFVIDQRKCIGCHACTVACKAENEVPVGNFRTWVKYVEKGSFPTVKRHFTVLRCNHCDEAPCVEICPVLALHKRPDAIVDLDRDLCIGCSACMQACPYDAIAMNPDSGVAEKCHYCAHRTELGLEPACVVVCPEHAIVPGDTDDPQSEIATLLREQPTTLRKPEKGTRPRVWYVDALPEALIPGSTREPDRWLWSDRAGTPPQAVPGFEAPPDLVTSLNVDHATVWGWHIWLYLFTKNVAAGAMLAAPFLAWLAPGGGAWPEIVALAFLALTGFLLVHDLGRPERFLKIVFHPNPKSWLVKGTWVLMVFGGLTTAALAARLAGQEGIADVLRWANLPAALLSSGYSAFLFAQCRGRDLWLEKGLFGTLVLRAAWLGTGVALLLPGAAEAAAWSWLVLGMLNVLWMVREVRHQAATPEAEKARRLMRAQAGYTTGLNFTIFGAAFGGMLVSAWPLSPLWSALVIAFAAAGILLMEKAWVESGQELPLS